MKSGFTLLETVIYLALFAIIMSGALTTTRQLITNAPRLENQTSADDEADFLEQKISWLLENNHLSDIQISGAGTILTIGHDTFAQDSTNGHLTLNNQPLNSDTVTVSRLLAEIYSPNVIEITLTINQQNFSLSRYVYP